MTRVIFAALTAVMLLAAAPAFAGEWGKKGCKSYNKVSHMQEQLGLSDEQADKVYNIMEDKKSQKADCNDKEKFTDQRECMTSLREQTSARLSEVLDEEQMALYKEMKKDWKMKK